MVVLDYGAPDGCFIQGRLLNNVYLRFFRNPAGFGTASPNMVNSGGREKGL
jgi:hypothetical protein